MMMQAPSVHDEMQTLTDLMARAGLPGGCRERLLHQVYLVCREMTRSAAFRAGRSGAGASAPGNPGQALEGKVLEDLLHRLPTTPGVKQLIARHVALVCAAVSREVRDARYFHAPLETILAFPALPGGVK